MDLLRQSIKNRPLGCPSEPVANFEVISRLLYRVDKHTASKLLEHLSGEYSAWKIYELYKVREMRHILLDYYGGKM